MSPCTCYLVLPLVHIGFLLVSLCRSREHLPRVSLVCPDLSFWLSKSMANGCKWHFFILFSIAANVHGTARASLVVWSFVSPCMVFSCAFIRPNWRKGSSSSWSAWQLGMDLMWLSVSECILVYLSVSQLRNLYRQGQEIVHVDGPLIGPLSPLDSEGTICTKEREAYPSPLTAPVALSWKEGTFHRNSGPQRNKWHLLCGH